MNDENVPSDLFELAFLGVGGGTPVADCNCGRTTYCDSDYYDDGELERLNEAREASPKLYDYQDGGSVGIYELFGRTFVFGCPCGGLVNLEQQIWNHREQITRYLTARAKAMIDEAEAVLSGLGVSK